MKRLPKSEVELGGTNTSWESAGVLRQIRAVKRPASHEYRGIPEPEPTIESLLETVAALKEVVEVIIGQRGQPDLQMLKNRDAAKLQDNAVAYLIERFTP